MTYLINHPNRQHNLMNVPIFAHCFLPMPSARRRRSQAPQVPINIAESDEAYQLTLVAPGLKKEYFHLSLENDLLTVKLEVPEDAESTSQHTRREFALGNFERRFRLSELIDGDQINATYQDGIMSLNLPKRVEVNQTRSIAVQ